MGMKKMILSLVLIIIFILPVKAENVGISFHVSVYGTGIYHPGDKRPLIISIENQATLNDFLLNENTSSLFKLVTTAYDVRVELRPFNAPITVENVNPVVLGDLPAGIVAKVPFVIKVWNNASDGTYLIDVVIKYRRIEYTPTQEGMLLNTVSDTYVKSVKIVIRKRDYDFSASVKGYVVAGGEGVIRVKIKNTGRYEMKNVSAALKVNPPLRPNPKAVTAYIGNLMPEASKTVVFKVMAMYGAFNGTYPAELILTFKTSSGIPMVLRKTIGIPVRGSCEFKAYVISSDVHSAKTIRVTQVQRIKMPSIPMMHLKGQEMTFSGVTTIPSRGFVRVRIEDLGVDVKDAYAILQFTTPLLKAENVPYIGNLRRGESVNLTFYVLSYADPGRYLGYIVIRYKRFGDELLSPKMYVSVYVSPNPAVKVVNVTSNLAVGLKGEIRVVLERPVKEAYLVSPEKTIIPVTSVSCGRVLRYMVDVSKNALPGYHPLYIIERFDEGPAKDLTSVAEIRVYVRPIIGRFEIISVKGVGLYPDCTGTVYVKIRNMGTTVYNAVAILTVNPPLSIAGTSTFSLTSQPGTYFLGTLRHNQTAVAKFRVTVNKKAGPGYYPIYIRIKYYDAQGYSYVTDTMVASVEVKEMPLLTPLTVSAVIIAAIGVALGVKFARKRK